MRNHWVQSMQAPGWRHEEPVLTQRETWHEAPPVGEDIRVRKQRPRAFTEPPRGRAAPAPLLGLRACTEVSEEGFAKNSSVIHVRVNIIPTVVAVDVLTRFSVASLSQCSNVLPTKPSPSSRTDG